VRALVAAGVLLLAAALGAAPGAPVAAASSATLAPVPPPPDPAALAALDPEPDRAPGVRRRAPCPPPVPTVGFGLGDVPPGPDPAAAWVSGRGEGQVVAVVDTGVAAVPRLAGRVVDGGDFVEDASGLDDCDGHGTAVAGVLAADPAPDDLLVGLAPGVRIVAVRQTSAFVTDGVTAGAGDVATLARAVQHAARTPGVGVMTLSLAACTSPEAAGGPALGALRAAVHAAVDAGVVVVAAAGNTGPGCGPQNTPGDVRTLPVPAWFDDDVLTVAAVGGDRAPAPGSLAGPWVDLAAPGRAPSSLAPGGGLTTALVAPDGAASPLIGTSFAVPRVAAAAALLRQQSPATPAREVAATLVRSAAPTPGLAPGVRDDAVGYGVLDAGAALRGDPPRTGPGVRVRATAPPTAAGPDRGLAVGVVALGVAVVAGLLVVLVRRRRGRR
jgi:membrane-anchored mycosin MYCP